MTSNTENGNIMMKTKFSPRKALQNEVKNLIGSYLIYLMLPYMIVQLQFMSSQWTIYN